MAKAGNTRAANRQRWHTHIEAWRDSGLTQRAYCAREAVKLCNSQRCLRVFRDDEVGAVSSSPETKVSMSSDCIFTNDFIKFISYQ